MNYILFCPERLFWPTGPSSLAQDGYRDSLAQNNCILCGHNWLLNIIKLTQNELNVSQSAKRQLRKNAGILFEK